MNLLWQWIDRLNSKWLLGALIIILMAFPYGFWLFVNKHSPNWCYLLFALWLGFFAVVSCLLILKIAKSGKTRNSPAPFFLGLFTLLAVGIWLFLVIPVSIPKITTKPVNLTIIATGQKNPAAQASEVWVQKLTYAGGEEVDIKQFTRGSNWELREESLLVSYQNQPATVSWSGKTGGDMTLVFTAHPWSGIAEIVWNKKRFTVDLYNPESTTRNVQLSFNPIIYQVPAQIEVLWQITTGASAGLGLFLLGAWLAARRGLNEPQIIRQYPQALVILGVLAVYTAAAAWLLPEGVSKEFFSRFAYFVIPLGLVFFAAMPLVTAWKKEKPQFLSKKKGRLGIGDLLLLLLPLAPVTQYILNNKEILTTREGVVLIGIYAALAALPVLVFPWLLRRAGGMRPLMSLGLAFSFSLTNMASLTNQFTWHERGDVLVQLAVFGFTWAVFWLLFHLKMKTFAYAAVVLFFAANTVFQFTTRGAAQPAAKVEEKQNKLAQLVGERKPVKTPNIYLLIYDAYVTSETMAAYGIDNRPQEQFLVEQGFKLYPKNYSIGASSLPSMGSVLDVFAKQIDPRKATSGNGAVQNLLHSFGYETNGLFTSGFLFLGHLPTYDFSFPGYADPLGYLIEGISTGEFKFDIGYEIVDSDQFSQEKEKVFTEEPNHPKFIYMHISAPDHSQNSGACMSDETAQYEGRLRQANEKMRGDVELITAQDPGGIIIVAGDHGPYLTKNCFNTIDQYPLSEITRLDLQDRFGSFLAIRWPSDDFEQYDEMTVLQDVFPAVFAYMFEDPSILQAKIEPKTVHDAAASGASILNGIIQGGVNDGEPLFLGPQQ